MKVAIILDPEFQALIPPLAPEEFAQLEANLLADGCRDPLVTWNSILLDGHNRYQICQKHGLPFETVAMEFSDREAAADWMDANQLGRRNLTPDQRSILRGRRYNRAKKAVGRPEKCGQTVHNTPERTAETIAKQHGVTERTIRRDGKRAEFVEKLAITEPEAAQAVRDGKKKINEVRRLARVADVKAAGKFPDAKYRILYADPPWKYGDQLTEAYGSTKFHYPAMSIPALCSLTDDEGKSVKDVIANDAVLFLWATSPLLEESFQIIRAWGFSYKTSFVWDKVKHNMGHYNSVRHEFLLVCTRGSCLPDKPKLFDSVQTVERSAKHSEKPECFREIIDTIYPHGKRIELFPRTEVKGWDRWGNQA